MRLLPTSSIALTTKYVVVVSTPTMLPTLLNLTTSPFSTSFIGTSNCSVTSYTLDIAGVVELDGNLPKRYVASVDFSSL